MNQAPQGRREAISTASSAAAAAEDTQYKLILSLAHRFEQLLAEEILPYWAQEGFDSDNGLFAERLDFVGRRITNIPHRAMVQARQIYVYSDAALSGRFCGGLDAVERAVASLLGCYLDDGDISQGFIFSVSDTCQSVSSDRDSYTHAFIVFALAFAYRVTGVRSLLHIADQTISFIEQHLTDKQNLGLFDSSRRPSGFRRQNPVMHLLEAYLALHEAAPEGPYLEKAGTLVDLFSTRLFQTEVGVLPEYFEQNWSIHANSRFAKVFEPGHHFEWISLLSRFDDLNGSDNSRLADSLWRSARSYGLAKSGHCYDEVGFDLRPAKLSTRLWPHAEGLKAASSRLCIGTTEATELVSLMLSRLSETFLYRPFLAGWIDHFDEDGKPLVDHVPASSLYHIYGACDGLLRNFKPVREKQPISSSPSDSLV